MPHSEDVRMAEQRDPGDRGLRSGWRGPMCKTRGLDLEHSDILTALDSWINTSFFLNWETNINIAIFLFCQVVFTKNSILHCHYHFIHTKTCKKNTI